MGLFKKRTHIGGIIAYLGIEDFWLSCTEDEQATLTRYYTSSLSSGSGNSLIKGIVTHSSETKLKFLSGCIGWAISEKNYSLADKLARYGNSKGYDGEDVLDIHFFLQTAANSYYKQRKTSPESIQSAEYYCLKDINLFPQYSNAFIDEYGSVPRITTFQMMIDLYDMMGRNSDAISICEKAIEYNLTTNLKGGYSAKLEKLRKKV